MEEPSAGEPPGEEHEPDAPGDTPPREVDTPETEQPEVAGAVVEDAPTQEPPAAEEPESPIPGDDGEVVAPFEKISALISERNQKARAAVEQEETAPPTRGYGQGHGGTGPGGACPQAPGPSPQGEKAGA